MDKTAIGRLALRHEGEWWNAYWSPDQHSMTKAVLIGSIRMSVVGPSGDPVYQGFIALMQDAFAEVTKQTLGQTPTWGGLERAPEDERSGHG